ncbi:ABC transporter ATP-binding protein [Myxococcota bacterium]|nr:ABC transporter ATP-binding protein [Myxococcota bacterium]
MSAAALRAEGLVKRYRRTRALDGFSVVVPRGSVCGLVGPNGAGKTTFLSVVAGFVAPDAGTVDLLGLGPFDAARHAGRVGILPQDAELPLASTPRQLLGVWGRLQGMGAAAAGRAVSVALEAVLLADRADQRVATLSHGMRRRLTVAAALLGDPELVILDEPTSGLDPVQAAHLRQRIAAERGRRTVLLSSHNLAEVESLCDHVVMVEAGRCPRQGPLRQVTGADRDVRVRLVPPFPAGRAEVVRLRLAVDDPRCLERATTELLAELLAEGATIAEVHQGDSLERRFLEGAGRLEGTDPASD